MKQDFSTPSAGSIFGFDWREPARWPLTPLILTILASIVIFSLVPSIDIWFSQALRWLFGGGQFLPKNGGIAGFIYDLTEWVARAMVIGAVAIWLISDYRGQPLWGMTRKTCIYLLLVLIIGPGFFANEVLKDHWGRARPSQIVEFGGDKPFTPALSPSTHCDDNCSFVGGHAAMAFSTIAIGLLAGRRQPRRILVATSLVFGTLVSLVRIAQGGHFLSDCVFGGLLVIIVALALHHWIFAKDGLNRWRWFRQGPPFQRANWAERLDRMVVEDGWIAIPAALLGWVRRTEVQTTFALGVVILFLITYVDRPVAIWARTLNADQQFWFRVLTDLGQSGPYLIGGLVVAFALGVARAHVPFLMDREDLKIWHNRVLFLIFSVAVSGIAVQFLKAIFGRPRPKVLMSEGDFDFGFFELGSRMASFPSGHSTTAATVAMVIVLFFPQWRNWAVLAAILVASTRIFVGAHYPSDVLAGLFFGTIMTIWCHHYWQQKSWGELGTKRGNPNGFSGI